MTEQRLTERAAFERWMIKTNGTGTPWQAWQAACAAILSADRGEPPNAILLNEAWRNGFAAGCGIKAEGGAAAPSTPQPAPDFSDYLEGEGKFLGPKWHDVARRAFDAGRRLRAQQPPKLPTEPVQTTNGEVSAAITECPYCLRTLHITLPWSKQKG